MPSLRLVVPARGASPSGGDVYDARLAAAWSQDHGRVDVVALPGSWPHPGPVERAALARALDGTDPVLVDGLVAGPCPAEVERAVARGTRVVLLVHLPLPAETGLPPAVSRALAQAEARVVRAVPDVVVTSEWSARDLARRYHRRDAIVAAPGAQPAPLAEGSSPPHLLVLAALTAVKNHAVLLPALSALRDLPWVATFAGPATAQPDVAARLVRGVHDAGLGDRITLPGAVTGADLEALWHRTDLLLVPSLVETYGLVVTEALARAVPALVAQGTGAVEALTRSVRDADGPGSPAPGLDVPQAGAAIDPTDPSAWHGALRRWLTTPEQRTGWRTAAGSRRQRLRTWADTAADLRRGLFGER